MTHFPISGKKSQQMLNNIGINPVSITRIKLPLSRYTNVWCHNWLNFKASSH